MTVTPLFHAGGFLETKLEQQLVKGHVGSAQWIDDTEQSQCALCVLPVPRAATQIRFRLPSLVASFEEWYSFDEKSPVDCF